VLLGGLGEAPRDRRHQRQVEAVLGRDALDQVGVLGRECEPEGRREVPLFDRLALDPQVGQVEGAALDGLEEQARIEVKPPASAIVSAAASTTARIQLLVTSLSLLPAPASPARIVRCPIASKTGWTRSLASSGPDSRTTSLPSAAGWRVPSTGASTNPTPWRFASAAQCLVASVPMVLIWTQSA